MTFYSYVLAGLEIGSSVPLADVPTTGFSDGRLAVEWSAKEPETDRWLEIPHSFTPTFVQDDGLRLVVCGKSLGPVEAGLTVRSAVPFAAILQGKVTLHAAGISLGETTVALIGASGAGKTTLSASLGKMGRILTDDLLACRIQSGLIIVPAVDEDASGSGKPLLAGLYFLERFDDISKLQLTRISSEECMQQLLHHGFGELGTQKARALQFDFYYRLATTVPGFLLEVPDDLSVLPEITRTLAEHIETLHNPNTPTPPGAP